MTDAAALKEGGLTHFCWIHAAEAVPNTMDAASKWPHGAFVYWQKARHAGPPATAPAEDSTGKETSKRRRAAVAEGAPVYFAVHSSTERDADFMTHSTFERVVRAACIGKE